MSVSYKIVYSSRRSLCLEVSRDGTVTVRAPFGTDKGKIDDFVKAHGSWLEKKLKESSEKRNIFEDDDPVVTNSLIDLAKKYIPGRVEYWAQITDLHPTGIKITRAKTRYGSCNSKNSLCFSCFLMRCSKEEVDYVIVHELAHIKEKNHGKRFYAIVERYLPDYRKNIYSLKHK